MAPKPKAFTFALFGKACPGGRSCREWLPSSAQEHGDMSLNMVFMDQRGTTFHDDLSQLEAGRSYGLTYDERCAGIGYRPSIITTRLTSKLAELSL